MAKTKRNKKALWRKAERKRYRGIQRQKERQPARTIILSVSVMGKQESAFCKAHRIK